MKLKKIAILMSCTTLALAVSSCSSNKTDAEVAKVQELNTAAQTTATDTQVTQTSTEDNATQATTSQASDTTDTTTADTTEEQAPATEQAEDIRPKLTMNADASYTVGFQIGDGISSQKFDLNNDQTIAGFQDAVAGTEPRISQNKIDRNMDSLKDKMMKKQLDLAKDNKVKSKEFIAEVTKMDNVVKVNDKVYYQVVKQGDGQKPNADSTVTIAYKGTTPVAAYDADKSKLDDVKAAKLIGPSFDSSDSATFPLNNLIQCWKDAIPEIPTGSTVVLYCAPDAAYGSRAPASIGPNQALSFEIKIKDFK